MADTSASGTGEIELDSVLDIGSLCSLVRVYPKNPPLQIPAGSCLDVQESTILAEILAAIVGEGQSSLVEVISIVEHAVKLAEENLTVPAGIKSPQLQIEP